MSSYDFLADFYDELTENVEYEKRAEYIYSLLKEYGVLDGCRILDLACGTGSLMCRFQDFGFKVIGLDASDEMLIRADSKCFGKATLLKSQMQDFQLPEKVAACVCSLDSINHLSSEEDVRDTFKSVKNSLSDGGLFIFDVNTVYKHNIVLADNTFAFEGDDYFICWDNEQLGDNTERIIIDIFVEDNGLYRRFTEDFNEKAYETDKLLSLLEPYFDVLGVFDDLSKNSPKYDSERIYFVCKGKNNG